MVVYTVHATKAGEVGAVEIVFRDESEARRYARDRSRDWRVVSTSVTGFSIGELGTRHPVAWYIEGEEQSPRFHGPERQFYPAGRPAGEDSGPRMHTTDRQGI